MLFGVLDGDTIISTRKGAGVGRLVLALVGGLLALGRVGDVGAGGGRREVAGDEGSGAGSDGDAPAASSKSSCGDALDRHVCCGKRGGWVVLCCCQVSDRMQCFGVEVEGQRNRSGWLWTEEVKLAAEERSQVGLPKNAGRPTKKESQVDQVEEEEVVLQGRPTGSRSC